VPEEEKAIPFHPPEDVARYRAAGEWGAETLSDLVAGNAAERGDAPALIGDRGSLNWERYDELGTELAGLLAGASFEPGAPLAVLLPDGPSVHVAYLACERAGHPIVAIAVRSGIREIAHVLRRTGAAAVITHEAFGRRPVAALHGGLREEGLGELRALVLPDLAVDGLAGATLDGATPPPPAEPTAPLNPDGLYLINSTSGTTGLPKCVVHNQNRWFSFARMAIEAGKFSTDEVVLSAVPSPYGFGLWSAHFVPALLGCPVVLMERFEVERMLELIEEYGVTFLACVTTQMMMMLGSPSFPNRNLAPLRTVFTGGEAVSAEAAARFEATTGAHVLQFYGSNENGAISVTSHGDADDQRLGTAGRPIAAMNVRLYDGEEDVTASGGPGQVATRGPTGCLGYYGDEEANAQLLNDDGWMLSGDLARIGADGFLRLTGRASDLIIRGGKNISAVAVESEASSHPAIALAAAVPAPDPVFGEKVCLCVELVPGTSLTLEQLTEHMTANGVSREWLPERLIVVDAMPRSAGEKVDKQSLKKLAAAPRIPPSLSRPGSSLRGRSVAHRDHG
jgi:acyl-CoA synthetase